LDKGFWIRKENRYKFLRFLIDQLKVEGETEFDALEKLYHVKKEQIKKVGGGGLLKYYNRSFARAVMDLVPAHPWQLWKFHENYCSPTFWKRLRELMLSGSTQEKQAANSVLRDYLETIAQRHGITTLDAWYRLTSKEMGYADYMRIHRLGGLQKLLPALYPDHSWKTRKFTEIRNRLDSETNLASIVETLLPL